MKRTDCDNSLPTRSRLAKHSRERGFTLIELLIVISIILILVGMAAGNYRHAVLRSRETVLKQDLQEMRKAIAARFIFHDTREPKLQSGSKCKNRKLNLWGIKGNYANRSSITVN